MPALSLKGLLSIAVRHERPGASIAVVSIGPRTFVADVTTPDGGCQRLRWAWRATPAGGVRIGGNCTAVAR